MNSKKSNKKQTNIDKSDELLQNLVEGVFIILGVVFIHLVQMIQDENYAPIQSYLLSQGNLTGLFTNLCAIIPLTYSKSTRRFCMSGTTYGWSVAGILIAVVIFAQAVSMVYPSVPIVKESLRSPWVAVIAHLILFGNILILACLEKQPDKIYINEKIH